MALFILLALFVVAAAAMLIGFAVKLAVSVFAVYALLLLILH